MSESRSEDSHHLRDDELRGSLRRALSEAESGAFLMVIWLIAGLFQVWAVALLLTLAYVPIAVVLLMNESRKAKKERSSPPSTSRLTFHVYPEVVGRAEFTDTVAVLVSRTSSFKVLGRSSLSVFHDAEKAVKGAGFYVVARELQEAEGQTKAYIAGLGQSYGGEEHIAAQVTTAGLTTSDKCLCEVAAFCDTSVMAERILTELCSALDLLAAFRVDGRVSKPRLLSESPVVVLSASPEEPPVVSLEATIQIEEDLIRLRLLLTNHSVHAIRNVDAWLVSYPSDLLELRSDDSRCITELGPDGRYESVFELGLLNDLAYGELISGASYVNFDGRVYTVAAEPLALSNVSQMLTPIALEREEFEYYRSALPTGEMTVRADDWNPEELYDRAVRTLGRFNLYKVHSSIEHSEGLTMAEVGGFAEGRRTMRKLAVTIYIYGPDHAVNPSCRIAVSAEDEALIDPTIREVRGRLEAWLCPSCDSDIDGENIQKMKSGKQVKCHCCGVTIDLRSCRNRNHRLEPVDSR